MPPYHQRSIREDAVRRTAVQIMNLDTFSRYGKDGESVAITGGDNFVCIVLIQGFPVVIALSKSASTFIGLVIICKYCIVWVICRVVDDEFVALAKDYY
ncbi:hypothetical protein F4774DRAFT_369716 [Daldinia eschscholtzii]|nr:hypothetical protein F4774DRAFT_369716 [Daldinia eschscholtzii]